MNYTDHKITLDIHATVSPVTIRMKKRESMRRLLIHLTEAGYPYHISEECRAVFTAKKPDGNVVFNHCTIDDCVIAYGVTEQTTAVPGLIPCEIQLYGADDALLVSSRFNIVVEDTVYDDDAEIESMPEANELTALISDATEAISGANDVAASLLEAKEKGEFNGPKGDPGNDGVSINGTGVDSVVLNSKNPEQASGDNSLAEGYRTKASGNRSHAEGDSTEAGWRSHAEGFLTLANNTSHAGGRLSKATGKGSFAHGVETYSIPGGKYFWAEGMSLDSVTFAVYDADDSNVNNYLSVGDYIRLTPDSDGNPVTDCRKVVGISGDGKTITIDYPFGDVNYTTPFTGGYYVEVAVGCLADAYGAHAEGYSTSAIGGNAVHAPHAEGKLTKASATGAHAEGNKTTASGFASHAEGNASQATNTSAHAEGYSTTASGAQSHTEGARTVASGSNSHAEGADTIARGAAQHAQGRFNIEDKSEKFAHIVGNGTSATDRKNAHTVDWNGNGWFAGDVYVGGSGQDDAKAEKLVKMSDLKEKLVGSKSRLTSTTMTFENDIFEAGKHYCIHFRVNGNYYYNAMLRFESGVSSVSSAVILLSEANPTYVCFHTPNLKENELILSLFDLTTGAPLAGDFYKKFVQISIYELPY